MILLVWQILHQMQRKSTYRISRHRRQIHQHSQEKPTRMDRYRRQKELWHQLSRSKFIVCQSDKWPKNRKEKDKTNNVVSNIFHERPKSKQRSLKSKRPTERQLIAHRLSCYRQYRPDQHFHRIQKELKSIYPRLKCSITISSTTCWISRRWGKYLSSKQKNHS